MKRRTADDVSGGVVSDLRPFFTYYGGKWAIAKRYPVPVHDIIVEPFAGSAGYSMRYPERRVILWDINPMIVGTWRYLISATAVDIRKLPLLEPGQSVDDLSVCQEARWLIGWLVNKGAASPHKTLSAWGRESRYASQFWGERVRERIAGQVHRVSHWKVFEGDYQSIDLPRAATWFIDPPYQAPVGRRYPFSDIDYGQLADWCRSRQGHVIVCENELADWLPFRSFMCRKRQWERIK